MNAEDQYGPNADPSGCRERGAVFCCLCGACSVCDPETAMAGYCYDSDDHKHLWPLSSR